MSRGNFFRRGFIALIGMIFALNASIACAEIYSGEGSYVMSKAETLEVALERAKADAMRNASEQAGVYVKSYARMKNFELEEDIVETMTANILKLIEKPIFQMLEQVNNLDGIMIHVNVKVQIDDSDINRWLNKDSQEIFTLVEQMKELRKVNEEQARIIEELKRQLANNPQDKEQITKQFADADKIFLSNQKVDEGWKLYYNRDYNGAIKLYNEAIELDSNSLAYCGRGNAYYELRQYDNAILDFNKAIELNPRYFQAYNNLGNVYHELRQYERAIQEQNKVIELNPKYFQAYNNLGNAYYELKQYELAIQEQDRAIQLNPSYFRAYDNRGNAYYKLGQYEQAIQDYSKAIELNPNDAETYYNRGNAYLTLRQNERAIQDYNKAIELNPNYNYAYNNRGWAYYCLKQYEKALKDFEKALELNPNNTPAKNNIELCRKAMRK